VEAPRDPLIGVLVDGRYRIDRVVGEGGFGTVYAAFHVGLGAKVAVKVPRVGDLPPSAVADEIAMFLDEGRTLKRLRHPNLVAALDVGLLPPDTSGRALPYLVLEWCEGPTLKDWLADHPSPSSREEAWALLRPAFDAIAHAHAHGVAHRDLKPANIILEPGRDGTLVPRVIDFGIAKVLGEGTGHDPSETRTASSRRAFTAKYAAPEQLAGVRTGPWTDVYALSLLLLEIIRGRPVFASEDEARNAMLEGTFPTPTSLGLSLGPWQRPLERALDPRPTQRFADASELMRALEGDASAPPAYRPEDRSARTGPRLSDSDDSAIPSSRTLRTSAQDTTAGPIPRRARRRSIAAVLAAAGVVLLGFGAMATIRYYRQENPRPRTDAASAPPSTPLPPSAAPPDPEPTTTARPLSSLTAEDLLSRSVASGLISCASTKLPAMIQITCQNGMVVLADRATGGVENETKKIRLNLQYQAKSHSLAYGAARFAIDGTWGVLIAAPEALVDDVATKVMLGTRHDEIGSNKISLEERGIPPRLAQWTGMELAPRLAAAGWDVTSDMPYETTPLATFASGKEAGTLMLVKSWGSTFLDTAKKPGSQPFAWAREGDIVLVSYGTPAAVRRELIQKIVEGMVGVETGQFP